MIVQFMLINTTQYNAFKVRQVMLAYACRCKYKYKGNDECKVVVHGYQLQHPRARVQCSCRENIARKEKKRKERFQRTVQKKKKRD